MSFLWYVLLMDITRHISRSRKANVTVENVIEAQAIYRNVSPAMYYFAAKTVLPLRPFANLRARSIDNKLFSAACSTDFPKTLTLPKSVLDSTDRYFDEAQVLGVSNPATDTSLTASLRLVTELSGSETGQPLVREQVEKDVVLSIHNYVTAKN